MSVQASTIIASAAINVGDPNYTTITKSEWLDWFNQISRTLATRMRLVKKLGVFTIQADNELYSMPDDCVQMTRVQYNPTPSNVRVYRDLKEYFEDEFRTYTDWNYPTGEPRHYFADQGFFYLLPRPTTLVASGGRVEYWGLPDAVGNLASDPIPFQDRMADCLLLGLEPFAYRRLEKVEMADRSEQKWERLIAQTESKLQDRSDDRRTRVRPASQTRGTWGQA